MWCEKKTNFTVFGAPWQADAQILFLSWKFKWIEGYISDDSDFFLFAGELGGIKEWHSGYSTLSTQNYRHVIKNKTKSRFLGKMSTQERYSA